MHAAKQRKMMKGSDFEVELSDEAQQSLVQRVEAQGVRRVSCDHTAAYPACPLTTVRGLCDQFTARMLIEPQKAGVGVAQHICQVVEDKDVHVIVIGADGMSKAVAGASAAATAGSTADHIVRAARCTVVVVKTPKS